MSKGKYKILVISWNTQSVGLCEDVDLDIVKEHRNSYFTTWNQNCEPADFFAGFKISIEINNPDIVVIGFQEDRFPGSYFHSHLLPTEMNKLQYGLIKRTKLEGIGSTSVKGAASGNIFARGIRQSIYCRKNLLDHIKYEEKELYKVMSNDAQSELVCGYSLVRGKGSVVSYLKLPDHEPIAFICCHLPFNMKSLTEAKMMNNKMIRQNEINYSNICFNNIVESLSLYSTIKPAHVIYYGDFNYRISYDSASTLANLINSNYNNKDFLGKLYQNNDELLQQMRKDNIYTFSEGVSNNGPLFAPTCKMKKNREEGLCYGYKVEKTDSRPEAGTDCYAVGKNDQRNPSWCDRILYKKLDNNIDDDLICYKYDRFDLGNTMTKSDHAGVFAYFELK
jgi:hypothetical protein